MHVTNLWRVEEAVRGFVTVRRPADLPGHADVACVHRQLLWLPHHINLNSRSVKIGLIAWILSFHGLPANCPLVIHKCSGAIPSN